LKKPSDRTGTLSGSQSPLMIASARAAVDQQSRQLWPQMSAAFDPRDDSHRQPNTADQAA